MQLLLKNDAMTNSLIRGGWETFENSNIRIDSLLQINFT